MLKKGDIVVCKKRLYRPIVDNNGYIVYKGFDEFGEYVIYKNNIDSIFVMDDINGLWMACDYDDSYIYKFSDYFWTAQEYRKLKLEKLENGRLEKG